MSNEDQKDVPAPPEEKRATPPEGFEHFEDPKAVFFVHNTARGRHNRTLRAQQPVHGGMRQHIGGEHRLTRGRPLGFTVEGIAKHIKELLEKEKAGLIEVKTRDGRRLDLLTGRLVPSGPPVVQSTPNFRPDSVAHDVNLGGHIMTQFPGDISPQDDDPNKVPDLLRTSLNAELEEAPPAPQPKDDPAPPPPLPLGSPPAPESALAQGDPASQAAADAADTDLFPGDYTENRDIPPGASIEGNLEGTSTESVPPPGGKKKGKSNR